VTPGGEGNFIASFLELVLNSLTNVVISLPGADNGQLCGLECMRRHDLDELTRNRTVDTQAADSDTGLASTLVDLATTVIAVAGR